MSLVVWSNAGYSGDAASLLREGLPPHRLIEPPLPAASNLVSGPADATLAAADVAFGQPDPEMACAADRLRWIHLSSAGYTRYDNATFREAMRSRGVKVTTSSGVYAEPCAQHVLAMILGVTRQLPASLDTQRRDRAWPMQERRAASSLLRDQRVLLLGFGAIGRRLSDLLAPFAPEVRALRRAATTGRDDVRVVTPGTLDEALAVADHVVDLLPESESTRGFMNASRFSAMKRGASFYNVGRGGTVDQSALLDALHTERLGAAYLDVTTPEPLPADHPLWTAPRCWITPHTAGGHANEEVRLVEHFLQNLASFASGRPLADRVM